jgi:predicted phosphodiesterase
MLQAILSDIHSNLEALQTCVGHARERSATHFACLGDCIGYGADAAPTLALLMSLPELLLVRGNHDEALFRDELIDVPGISESLALARSQMTLAHRCLLSEAPYLRHLGRATYAHASAHRPEAWEYLRWPEQIEACLAATDTPVTFIGHVHVPMVFCRDGTGVLRELYPQPGTPLALLPDCRYVINVGSVGQPRDGNTTTGYVLYDDSVATVTFYRLPYDHIGAAGKIRAAGLNPQFAERLLHGQ